MHKCWKLQKWFTKCDHKLTPKSKRLFEYEKSFSTQRYTQANTHTYTHTHTFGQLCCISGTNILLSPFYICTFLLLTHLHVLFYRPTNFHTKWHRLPVGCGRTCVGVCVCVWFCKHQFKCLFFGEHSCWQNGVNAFLVNAKLQQQQRRQHFQELGKKSTIIWLPFFCHQLEKAQTIINDIWSRLKSTLWDKNWRRKIWTSVFLKIIFFPK